MRMASDGSGNGGIGYEAADEIQVARDETCCKLLDGIRFCKIQQP